MLRVIEYHYATAERFAEDQARWTMRHSSRDMNMQSAVVSITTTEEPDPQPAWKREPEPDLYPCAVGPETYQVCRTCDLDVHRCGACGEELTHAEATDDRHLRQCRPDLYDENGVWIG